MVGGFAGLLRRLLGREACPNAPADVRVRREGICHICGEYIPVVPGSRRVKEQGVGFCDVCCHWFDRDCSHEYGKRGWAALWELVGGPREGCCGPLPEGSRSCLHCEVLMGGCPDGWVCPVCGRIEQ